MGFWTYFKEAIYLVIDLLFRLCGDWGVAIILITIIFRMLILPITIRQSNSQFKMQKLQPAMKAIQEKYADDKVRQNEEMMKLYSEAKYNPLSGCLPMLLQMPIFAALFQVLRELESLIIKAGHADEVLPASLFNIIPDLSVSAKAIFTFTPEGFITSLPYLIMLLLFGVSMLIPMLLNPNTDKNTLLITGFMSIMMLSFGWNTPAGVLLYWDTSSIIGSVQQAIVKMINQRKEQNEEEELIEIKPVKVDVERKERKNRPRKTK
ncbi:MAG: YidC/Oxa1 family membrane protein insertase [Coriobacteriia bacterium]|nr:YidC/Oxa1 family membrane protein insertase [Coriobacteriia bacterium]